MMTPSTYPSCSALHCTFLPFVNICRPQGGFTYSCNFFISSCWLLLFLSKAWVEGWINIATKSETESLLELVALSDCGGNHQHKTT